MKGSDEELRKRILDAADEVFKTNGFKAADMRSIAKIAGTAVGTLYNYFPNKAQLFGAIMKRKWEIIDEAVSQVIGDENLSFKEKTVKICSGQLGFIKEHRALWMEIMESPESCKLIDNEEARCFHTRYQELIGLLLEKEVDKRSVDRFGIDRLAAIFMGGIGHYCMHYYDDKENFCQGPELVAEILINGIKCDLNNILQEGNK